MPRIEGKVAGILNRRELVLNVGQADGVEERMKFAILNTRGLTIPDPDTGEFLGSVEIAKVLVQVVRVQDKLSVARTFRTTKTNVGGALGIPDGLFEARRIVEVPETLQADENQYKAELSEEESLVKVGDVAVQTTGDEFL